MWLHWRSADDDSRRARWLILGATVVFVVLACGGEPWNLFSRAGFSSDFYESQARAYLHGHLDVPPAAAGLEGLVVDGRTYLYYGPMLAIVRMPFVLFGDFADGRLARLSMTIAFMVCATMAFHLARRVRTLLVGDDGSGDADRVETIADDGDDEPLRANDTGDTAVAAESSDPSPRRTHGWDRGSLIVTATVASPLLYLAGWTSVYHETEMWACALALATAVALLDLYRHPSRRAVSIAGLLAIATVLTRSSVGFGALAALAGVGVLLVRRDRRVTGFAFALMAVGLIANSGLNYAKFGEPVDIPADQQVLVLQDPSRAEWFASNNGSFFSPRFLSTTLVQYLRPDAIRFERLVPVVRFGPLATERGSYPLAGNTPASSLPVAATALSALALIGLVVIVRRRSWVLLTLTAGGLVAAVPSFVIGFIANRYLVDMLPALIVPATAAIAVAPTRRLATRATAVAAIATLVWGGWVNASMAIWTQNMKEPGFTATRYRIDDAVFGGAPPSVVTLDRAGGSVPRDGVVGIDGECAGLYIAEQGTWVPLERADGIRRLQGELTVLPDLGDSATADDVAAFGVVVTSPDGRLVVAPDEVDGQRSLSTRFDPASPGSGPINSAVIGEPVPWDGQPVRIDVISDPVTGEFAVTVDGRSALYTFGAPQLDGATIAPNLVVDHPADAGTPTCRRLLARR